MKCEFIETCSNSVISICEFEKRCLSENHKTCETYGYNLKNSLSKYPSEWREIYDVLSKTITEEEWVGEDGINHIKGFINMMDEKTSDSLQGSKTNE